MGMAAWEEAWSPQHHPDQQGRSGAMGGFGMLQDSTFVELLVGGKPGILLLACTLGFVVVESVTPINGLVGEDNTWRTGTEGHALTMEVWLLAPGIWC